MVEGNRLSEWPAAFSALKNLNHIYIWNNLFASFPKNMLLLPNLHTYAQKTIIFLCCTDGNSCLEQCRVSIEGNLIEEFDDEMWKIVSSGKYTIKHSLPCRFAPRLYLGDSTASKNLNALLKNHITHVLVLDGGVVPFPEVRNTRLPSQLLWVILTLPFPFCLEIYV